MMKGGIIMSLLGRQTFVEIVKKPKHRYDFGLFEIKGLPNLYFRFTFLDGGANSLMIHYSGEALKSMDGSFVKGEKVPYNFSPQKIKIIREDIKYLLSFHDQ